VPGRSHGQSTGSAPENRDSGTLAEHSPLCRLTEGAVRHPLKIKGVVRASDRRLVALVRFRQHACAVCARSRGCFGCRARGSSWDVIHSSGGGRHRSSDCTAGQHRGCHRHRDPRRRSVVGGRREPVLDRRLPVEGRRSALSVARWPASTRLAQVKVQGAHGAVRLTASQKPQLCWLLMALVGVSALSPAGTSDITGRPRVS
jgi:hypothetical protein